jgi:catechol 2,3-dioxygenase-like lactoylglutathione lyase family enzyme
VDLKFEAVVIPVSDVDRAKEFYARLGWRLDADLSPGDGFRIVPCTPTRVGLFGPIRHKGHVGAARVGPGPVQSGEGLPG